MRRTPCLSAKAALAAAVTLLAGCSLAPPVELPDAPVAAQFPVTAPATPAIDIADDARAMFVDPRLRAVIERALDNNRDLRVALLDVERAQALYRVQRADLLPDVAASGSYTRQRLSEDTSGTGEPLITDTYSVDLGVAAWELDLFGRVRSLSDQALQSFFATRWAAESTRLTLIASVTDAWLTLAADRSLLRLATETQDNRESALELVSRRHAVGVGSALDVRQAESALAPVRADVARYAAIVAQDRNALELLVGAPLDAAWLPDTLDLDAVGLPEVPSGLPSELLLRRPDIASAEASLRAANANIGAARAAFFPSISLTAGIGSTSSDLDGLFESGTKTWIFAPQINLPIFSGGANRANLAAAEASRDIAVAQYEQAIQSAFRDVADALALQASVGEQLAAGRAATEASAATLTLSQARFKVGVDNYLAVLDAQRTLYSAQQTLIATQQIQQSNRVALFRALAGRWPEPDGPSDAGTAPADTVGDAG